MWDVCKDMLTYSAKQVHNNLIRMKRPFQSFPYMQTIFSNVLTSLRKQHFKKHIQQDLMDPNTSSSIMIIMNEMKAYEGTFWHSSVALSPDI